MADKRGRGRPATGRKPSVHLRVDKDVFDRFRVVGDKLEKDVGFKPTSNQILRYLIQRAEEAAEQA